MNVLLVTPKQLRAWWPNVRASLDAVLAKAPEDWIAEDVYHAVKAGSAALYVGVGDAGYLGCLVLTEREAEFSGEKSCHVWITHSMGDADVFTAGLGLVRAAAKQMGAARITFGSPRLGWAKRFPLVSATYQIGVTP